MRPHRRCRQQRRVWPSEAPSSKHYPAGKHQTSNTKLRRNTKRQTPNSREALKLQTPNRDSTAVWCLVFHWCFEIGVWCFCEAWCFPGVWSLVLDDSERLRGWAELSSAENFVRSC